MDPGGSHCWSISVCLDAWLLTTFWTRNWSREMTDPLLANSLGAVYQGISTHKKQTFPCGGNGCVRVDALCQNCQRHPGGRWLQAGRRYQTTRCISPFEHGLAGCSSSVGLLFWNIFGFVAKCDHRTEWIHWVHAFIGITMEWVTLWKSLLVFLPPGHKMQFSLD